METNICKAPVSLFRRLDESFVKTWSDFREEDDSSKSARYQTIVDINIL